MICKQYGFDPIAFLCDPIAFLIAFAIGAREGSLLILDCWWIMWVHAVLISGVFSGMDILGWTVNIVL
jgi:hypothetical protein